MAIYVTNIGLQAITGAYESINGTPIPYDGLGGFLVDLKTFAVTEAQNVKLDVKDVALVGTPVYNAEIESIEVVSSCTIKCTLLLPSNVPLSGSLELKEIGLFLASGELFAHGTFAIPYSKSPGFSLRLYALVSAAHLGDVINVTLGTNCSLASAAAVRSLIAPQKSYTNAVVVQDQLTNIDSAGVPTAGGLAVRYGAGGINWAFLGYDLQYAGHPTVVTNPSLFQLSVNQNGFWLNDNEIVIVQAVSGAGAGESRRVRFNKPSQFTVLEKPFTTFNAQSVIHIWRSTVNDLPSRPGIDLNYVLGVGVDDWQSAPDQENPIPVGTIIIPHRASFVSDGQNLEFQIPALEVGESCNFPDDAVIYIDGLEQPHLAGYTIDSVGALEFINPIAINTIIEVVYHVQRLATQQEGLGSYLIISVAEYPADGTREFSTSIVPDSDDYLLVFIGGRLIPRSFYTYEPTTVTFSVTPTDKVTFVQYANYYENGARSNIRRWETHPLADLEPITLGNVLFLEKKNTLVYLDGRILDQNEYQIDVNQLVLTHQQSTNSVVSVISALTELAIIIEPTMTGQDTGPVWVDPAGVYVRPNKVVAWQTDHFGNGSTQEFDVVVPPTFALVFIDGAYQEPSNYILDYAAKKLIFSEAPGNYPIAIISFNVIDDVGEELVCTSHIFTIESGVYTYPIQSDTQDGETLVHSMEILTAGGVFQHSYTYSTDDTDPLNPVLTFDADALPDAGFVCELWRLRSRPNPGHSTVIDYRNFTMHNGITEYIHRANSGIGINYNEIDESNTFLFSNTVLQLRDRISDPVDYGYTTYNDGLNFTYNIPRPQDSINCTSVVFFNGISKTRLMLRQEMLDDYLTRQEFDAVLDDRVRDVQTVMALDQETFIEGAADANAYTTLLSHEVSISGTRPLSVWASWIALGIHVPEVIDNENPDITWEVNEHNTDCAIKFELVQGSTRIVGPTTGGSVVLIGTGISQSAQAKFDNVPRGIYTLMLSMARRLTSQDKYAVSTRSMSFVEGR